MPDRSFCSDYTLLADDVPQESFHKEDKAVKIKDCQYFNVGFG